MLHHHVHAPSSALRADGYQPQPRETHILETKRMKLGKWCPASREFLITKKPQQRQSLLSLLALFSGFNFTHKIYTICNGMVELDLHSSLCFFAIAYRVKERGIKYHVPDTLTTLYFHFGFPCKEAGIHNNVNSALAYCEQQLEREGDGYLPISEDHFYEDLSQATELRLTWFPLGRTTLPCDLERSGKCYGWLTGDIGCGRPLFGVWI